MLSFTNTLMKRNESTSEDKLDTEVKKDMILNNPYN